MANVISWQRTIVTALLCIFAALILLSVAPSQVTIAHQNLNSADFLKLSREEQVKVCGSCHVQAYENEKKGPHANAYRKLAEHVAFVNSSAFNQPEYTRFVNAAVGKCAGCHAPQNLFETVYKGLATADNTKIEEAFKSGLPMPEVRKDTLSLFTGVDCLSCHFDGKQVVAVHALSAEQKDSCPGFCSPVASKFFSSDLSCISCHSEAVKSQHSSPLSIVNKPTCSGSCHQEIIDGKATHYYYWLNDAADKNRTPVMGGIFETIEALYHKDSATVELSWINHSLTHDMNECREVITNAQITDEHGVVLASGDIRLNRKTFHDESTLQPFFGNKKVPGVAGSEFTKSNSRVTKLLYLLHPADSLNVIITGSHKAQYWLPDSLAVPVYKKTWSLN